MTVSIETSAPADAAMWDELWRTCPYATYFHSREWAELWSAYSCGRVRPAPEQVTFSDGARALLPLSTEKHSRSFPRQCVSSPAGTYGGWLGGVDLGTAHKALLVKHLVGRRGDLVWRVNPFEGFELPQGLPSEHDDTQALSLAEGFPSLMKRSTKGHRSAARQAERAGVTVSPAETREAWSDFAGIYGASVRRWGAQASSTYGSTLFESLRARAGSNVRLWLAYHEGAPVAGALCLYAPRHVAYWLGAALEEFFPLRPVHLLVYRAVEDACRSDREWFDFNPSGGHEGVAAFKKGFGATRLPAPMIIRRGLVSRSVAAARRRLP